MYVVVHHHISDPREFWATVQAATPTLPPSLSIQHCLPVEDGSEAVCVWEGPSLETVRNAVVETVGEYSRNEYFESEAKEGVNLPAAVAAGP